MKEVHVSASSSGVGLNTVQKKLILVAGTKARRQPSATLAHVSLSDYPRPQNSDPSSGQTFHYNSLINSRIATKFNRRLIN